MKIKIIACLLLAFVVTNSVSAQKKGKWVSLFDGTTTTGWHTYGYESAGQGWKVIDGAIQMDPTVKGEGRGDLVSDLSFNDFHLKLEWKIAPKGNSGLIFFLQDDKKKYKDTYFTGPEMQVLDNDGHSDGKLPSHRAGSLYDLIAAPEGAVKAVGEWNKVDIINKDGLLTLKLNGVTTAEIKLGSEEWLALIQKSKFNNPKTPDFGKIFAGHIALQDHGNEVAFRNIKIRNF